MKYNSENLFKFTCHFLKKNNLLKFYKDEYFAVNRGKNINNMYYALKKSCIDSFENKDIDFRYLDYSPLTKTSKGWSSFGSIYGRDFWKRFMNNFKKEMIKEFTF